MVTVYGAVPPEAVSVCDQVLPTVAADSGRTYRDILQHYYPETELQQLY